VALQKHVPGIKVRVVNVVDLMTLMYPDKHPHGMDEMSFNALFTEKCARDLRLPQQSLAHSHPGSWALQ
jgi:phosphoketolase